MKLEIQNTNIILQHTRTELKEKKIENERLYKTLSDDEIKLMKLRKELDNATNDKDLIGTQMIRRNDEIGLLNEKNNIIQMALDRGIPRMAVTIKQNVLTTQLCRFTLQVKLNTISDWTTYDCLKSKSAIFDHSETC